MTTTTELLLIAGIAGGMVNALAGGATLITFPAMLAAGLPPVVANASNAVAIAPGHLIAALVDRRQLPRFDSSLMLAVAMSAGGGLAGALLLLVLPERLIILPLPALIGGATLLFVAAPRLQVWALKRQTERGSPHVGALFALAGASIYGGFFGAGLGILLTAMLAIFNAGELRAIKALKNLLATSVSVAATALFIVRGIVAWQQTVVMLTGALAGGYAGGLLIRTMPAGIVRSIVIAAGALMTIIYAYRYWF
ncbi:TSUP family transporter [Paraburkholderia fungorum]|uniref:sulfite exporter TauE/SafE family protein n=1 Tax=Paraburkholderia fungorum TaxID=134537 RepID=UPI0038BC61BE